MIQVQDRVVPADKGQGVGNVKVPDDGFTVVLLDDDVRGQRLSLVDGPDLEVKIQWGSKLKIQRGSKYCCSNCKVRLIYHVWIKSAVWINRQSPVKSPDIKTL